MLTNTIAYGTTKKGNFYEYEKTNKGKKIGAGAGAIAVAGDLTEKLISEHPVVNIGDNPNVIHKVITTYERGITTLKNEMKEWSEELFGILKDKKYIKTAGATLISKMFPVAAIGLGFALTVGCGAGLGKLIGSIFDNHKNKDAKKQAMNEADLQAARAKAQKTTEE